MFCQKCGWGIPILIMCCIAFALVVGCTSQAEPPKATPAQNTVQPAPVITDVMTSVPTTIMTPPPVTATAADQVLGSSSASPSSSLKDPPYVNNLAFKKGYFSAPSFNHIDNCPMKEIFPEVAKDPGYGLLADPPKVTAYSAGQIREFEREYLEGKGDNQKMVGISRCEGAVVNPYWNFVEVSAKLTPTNGNPANYNVIMSVKSHGKVVSEIKTKELLTLNEIVSFTSYIPLKTNEMDAFDGVDLSFEKLDN